MNKQLNMILIFIPATGIALHADVSDQVYSKWLQSESSGFASLSKKTMWSKLQQTVERVYWDTIEDQMFGGSDPFDDQMANSSKESDENKEKDICLAVFLWRALQTAAKPEDTRYRGYPVSTRTLKRLRIVSSENVTGRNHQAVELYVRNMHNPASEQVGPMVATAPEGDVVGAATDPQVATGAPFIARQLHATN